MNKRSFGERIKNFEYKMKILILSNNAAGLYKFRKELLIDLISKGFEVYLSISPDEYSEKIREIGCYILNTELDRRGTNPIKDFLLILAYRKYIKRIGPDVVLTYTIKPDIYGGLTCAFYNVPYISNVTGLGSSIENKGILRRLTLLLYKLALSNAEKVFFQNQANKDYFEKIGITEANSQLIPGSGVNLIENCYEPYPPEDGSLRFLFIGRIMKDKGIEELFECAKKVRADHKSVLFNIVGPCEEKYQEELQLLEKEGILKYFGQQDDVHSFMKTHHAIILPSYHEGLSNVLLEAAACGRPVLATDIPGCRETYEDRVSGLGFSAKSTEALTEAVERFIQLPYAQKEEMGTEGRKKVEREFNRQIVVLAYTNEINEIGIRKKEKMAYGRI